LSEKKQTRLTYLQVPAYIPYPHPNTNPDPKPNPNLNTSEYTVDCDWSESDRGPITFFLTAAPRLFTAPNPTLTNQKEHNPNLLS
jgi:hypothetical protein